MHNVVDPAPNNGGVYVYTYKWDYFLIIWAYLALNAFATASITWSNNAEWSDRLPANLSTTGLNNLNKQVIHIQVIRRIFLVRLIQIDW